MQAFFVTDSHYQRRLFSLSKWYLSSLSFSKKNRASSEPLPEISVSR